MKMKITKIFSNRSMKTKGVRISILGAALLAVSFGALEPAAAGERIRASIKPLVQCTLYGNTLTVNVDAEKKNPDAPDPDITAELVTLESKVGRTVTREAPELYDTDDTSGGYTVNSVQNSHIPDALVPFGELPLYFSVDLCADPVLDISGAKALGVDVEITIANASGGRNSTGPKTFSATCKVIGLPDCSP